VIVALMKPGSVRALVVIALAAVAVTGCGGSSGVKPAAYVRSMCIALGNWKSDIQRAGLQLQSSGARSASRALAKQDYHRFVGALLAATQRATSALQSAGTPSVTNGKQIADSLAGAFSSASRKLTQADAEAGSISTASASAFQLGASSVSTQIKAALQGIAAVTPNQSAELRAAAAKEPACQVLRG
jgi:hypothetical protein